MKKSIAKFTKNLKINEKSINFLLIFILGFLVGVAVKTEAKKRITIGYNDYQVSGMKQGFDLMNQAAPQPQPAGSNNSAPQPDNGAGATSNPDSGNGDNGNAPPQ